MGYVGFSILKQSKNLEISICQAKLTSNMEARRKMSVYGGIISDGVITPDERANNPMLHNNLVEFMAGAEAFRTSGQGGGDISNQLIDQVTNQGYDEKTKAVIIENLNRQLDLEYANIKRQELAQNEMILDNEKKQIETQLQIAMQELQAIEKAEAEAIQRAVPKYSGLQG